jgi:hypothetical protein
MRALLYRGGRMYAGAPIASTNKRRRSMEKQYIGCDAHRRYSVFVVMDDKGQASKPVRVEHDRSELREYLRRLPAGSRVAIESTGGWYWLVDEIEAAGLKTTTGQRLSSETAHEGSQQDGQVRRTGTGHGTTDRNSPDRVDSAGRTAGLAGTNADPAGITVLQHAGQKPSLSSPESIRIEETGRGWRSVHRAGTSTSQQPYSVFAGGDARSDSP